MEPLSNQLSEIASKQTLTLSSKKQNELSVLPEEQKILDVKYKSKRFGEMSEVELVTLAHTLIVKIHVLTGWAIPQNEFMDILADQFRKKLTESYASVNPHEIEYAFRNNTSVKDWGKSMNLSLIDEVMLPYLEQRFELSKMEEQKAKAMLEAPKEDLSDIAMEDWMSDVSLRIQKGNYSVEFVPEMIYDWMNKKGRIKKSPAEKRNYLVKAVAHRQARLAASLQENETTENRKVFDEFVEMNNSGCFTGDEVERLKILAKKMILYDMLSAEPK